MKKHSAEFVRKLSPVLILLCCLCSLIFTAWIADDALIAFRSVANMHDGFGLRWNVSERVQSFTSPLWTLLIAGGYAISGEFFYAPLLLCLVCSLLTCWILQKNLRGQVLLQWGFLLALLCSNGFVDFSTSGLENPLLHLLVCCFILISANPVGSPGKLCSGTLLISLIMLTRHDAVLLVLPVYCWWLVKCLRDCVRCPDRGTRLLLLVGLGLGAAPFALWTAFSFFYYGSFLPNTAYAKLSLGLPVNSLLSQGAHYLKYNATQDPVTSLIIAAGLVLGFLAPSARLRFVAFGILLQLAYLLRIGGDFMQGRFLSAAFVLALMILSCRLPGMSAAFRRRAFFIICIVSTLAIGLDRVSALQYKVADMSDFQKWYLKWCPDDGVICDERGVYFERLGFLPVILRGEVQPDCLARSRLREAVSTQPPFTVQTVGAAGEAGFRFSRDVHLLDPMGLSDPLLARSPAMPGQHRPGHYPRSIPSGYRESLQSDLNLLVDRSLRRKYREIRLLTRYPLFHPRRLACLWHKLMSRSCKDLR